MNFSLLRALRKESGKSQQEIADYLGIKRPTYVRYETGSILPPSDKVKRLAEYFGVTSDDLLDDSKTLESITGIDAKERYYPIRLKKLRKSQNMTQQDVADHLGITRVSYARYEGGQREPDYDTLRKLAILFGVSTDYLLGLTDEPLYVHEYPTARGGKAVYPSTKKEGPTPEEREAFEAAAYDDSIPTYDLSNLEGSGLPAEVQEVFRRIARQEAERVMRESDDKKRKD